MSSFDRQQTDAKGAPGVFVSPAIISLIIVVGLFLLVTWHAFSTQRFAWLTLIPGIPVAVFLINRRDLFLMVIIFITEANIWVPMAGNDVPFHIFLRLALVTVLLATSILTPGTRSRRDITRMATFAWLLLVLITMAARGTGIRQLGSHLWGGKNYILLITILLFFLTVPTHIRLSRKQWTLTIIFAALLPLVSLMADLLFIFSGGKLYFLYYIFKPGAGVTSAASTLASDVTEGVWRLQGASQLDLLMLGLLFFPKLSKSPHGKLILLFLLCGAIFFAAFSGFRGSLILIAGVLGIFLWLFYPQYRGRLITLAILAAGGLILFAATFAQEMPLPVQRVLSIVPMANINPIVQIDATESTSWRLEIWNLVIRNEIRPHLFLGRGLCFDPNHLIPQLTLYQDTWETILNAVTTGNFHSGPLSVLVSFGIPGLLLLLLITISAAVKHWRVHFKPWHDEQLRLIHLILYAYSLHMTLGFWFIYGDLTFMMIRYFSLLTFMEILAATREEEVDLKNYVPREIPKLLTEPVRNRIIRYT